CAPWLKAQVAEAVSTEGFPVFELPSGAGHDGMAMIAIADVAMIFVRCRGGISHHPDEHVETADADAGARVLLRLIENFRPRETWRGLCSPSPACGEVITPSSRDGGHPAEQDIDRPAQNFQRIRGTCAAA